MSKKCKKCENFIPTWFEVNGKMRNFKGRKYCLECSPFGLHNTKRLHLTPADKLCIDCGKDVSARRSTRCPSCNYHKQWNKRKNIVYDLVGTSCWCCGYDKGMAGTSVLDFHHMNPEEKKHGVTRREIATMAWEKVFKEMKKCCLLCCRCHRELHAGLIKTDVIFELFHKKWKDISAR